jgi:hypothetical protein
MVLLLGTFVIKGRFQGQRTHPLSSKMSKLDYQMEVPSSCGLEDANFIGFCSGNLSDRWSQCCGRISCLQLVATWPTI